MCKIPSPALSPQINFVAIEFALIGVYRMSIQIESVYPS